MAKREREQMLKERRERKQEKKQAAQAAKGLDGDRVEEQSSEEPAPDSSSPEAPTT